MNLDHGVVELLCYTRQPRNLLRPAGCSAAAGQAAGRGAGRVPDGAAAEGEPAVGHAQRAAVAAQRRPHRHVPGAPVELGCRG